MNADNNSKTAANIRSVIKERVATQNVTNAARIARSNTIPTDQVFTRSTIISLLIPKAIRLASELRRIYARVVQYTRTGY